MVGASQPLVPLGTCCTEGELVLCGEEVSLEG